jgi:DNA-binding GntR family transcriptional regulator
MPDILCPIDAPPDRVQQVYHRLLEAISDGTMPAGMRLTQEDLAARLGVSRQPVLQALRQLKAEGWVQDAPGQHGHRGRGVVVAELDATAIGHVYAIRGALDELAAALAAERRVVMDSALIARGRAASDSGDVIALMDADLAFHRALYQASGNPLIEASAMLHWAHIRRAMAEVLRRVPQRVAVWDEHEAMAAAVAAGDVVRAKQLVHAHALHARTQLVRHLSGTCEMLAPGAQPTPPPSPHSEGPDA